MLCDRKKMFNLVVDGMSAHKKAVVKTYVAKTDGELTRHSLPGYALNLNPDGLVWSHVRHRGVTKLFLKNSEKSQKCVNRRW